MKLLAALALLFFSTLAVAAPNTSGPTSNGAPSLPSPILFPQNSTPTWNNVTPMNTLVWRSIVARVTQSNIIGGTGIDLPKDATIIVGPADSTAFGYRCSGSANNDVSRCSWPYMLGKKLNAAGIPTETNGFLGWHNRCGAYDSRIVCNSSWTENVLHPSVGGGLVEATTSTNALTFTPDDMIDTFRIWYACFPGTNTGTIQIDNGTANSFDFGTPGNNNLCNTTVSAGTLGYHTISIKQTAGTVGIDGFDAWDSSKHWIHLINAGWVGSTVQTWIQTGHNYNPLPAMATLAPDMWLTNLMINDWVGAEPLATYYADYQILLTQMASTGAGIVMSSANPTCTTVQTNCPSGTVPLATQYTYVQKAYALSNLNNVPLIDIWQQFGSWDNIAKRGGEQDQLHQNAMGYNMYAEAMASFLEAQVGTGPYYPINNNIYSSTSTFGPFTSSSTTPTMAGFAWTFTPRQTGRIKVTVDGYLTENNATGSASVFTRYGTGTAPTSGAAVSGTTTTINAKPGSCGTTNCSISFTQVSEVNGLTAATPIWIDLSLSSSTAGTATVTVTSIKIEEY